MGLFSFSGLASGLDTASMVEQLTQIQRQPIRDIEGKQKNLNSVKSRLSSIKTLLQTLQEKATGLNSRDEVLATQGTSSNTDAVGISVLGGASLGKYDVVVTQLATAERTYSDAFADVDSTGLFGEGTLSIQVGAAAAVDITVDATDSLSSVAGKINGSGADVTAGILFDGTEYRLQVTGNETGAANAITFTEDGTLTLNLDEPNPPDPADPTHEVVAAQDAVFTVDGFAMSSATNLVDDALTGVTLDLKEVGTSTIEVKRDPAGLAEKLKVFVSAYNNATGTINKEFSYGGEARLGDSLSGDSTLRTIQQRLASTLVGSVSELTDAGADYDHLAQIGLSVDRHGVLSLDESRLESALADDAEGVAAMLMNDPDTGIAGKMAIFDDVIEGFVDFNDGSLSIRIDGIDDTVRNFDDQIEKMEFRIEKYEEGLRAQFTAMETMMATIQAQGSQLMSILAGIQNTGG